MKALLCSCMLFMLFATNSFCYPKTLDLSSEVKNNSNYDLLFEYYFSDGILDPKTTDQLLIPAGHSAILNIKGIPDCRYDTKFVDYRVFIVSNGKFIEHFDYDVGVDYYHLTYPECISYCITSKDGHTFFSTLVPGKEQNMVTGKILEANFSYGDVFLASSKAVMTNKPVN